MKELTQASKRLSEDIVRIKQGQPETSRRHSSRKSWSQYSRQHRSAKAKAIGKGTKVALSFLESEGFKAKSITLKELETSQTHVLDLERCKFSQSSSSSMHDASDEDLTYLALYIKEHFCVSNEAYHELSMVCKDMPRSWKLKDVVQKLNSKSEIKPTPGYTGVQQSLRTRLTRRIECLIETVPIHSTDHVLRVKLSGDGTKIGKNLHVINFTFVLPDEEQSLSAAGNHTIAILKIPEAYEELLGLSDIAREVEQLNCIEVNGINFKLEFFLSGDWKFLALVLGLDAANSNHSSCGANALQRSDMT